LRAKGAEVNGHAQRIAFEKTEVVFHKHARENLFLGHFLHLILGSLLQNATILLFILAGVACFHPLGLDQLRLSQLFVLGFVVLELLKLPFLRDFNLRLVQSFANQDLQDWIGFSIKVEQRSGVQLVLLIDAVKLRDEDRVRCLIDIKVRLNLKLVHLT
jgi:hypothetical protein